MICGIVLYNPQLDRLKDNLEIISKETEELVFFNNGCSEECLKYINGVSNKNVTILGKGQNVGIASALNGIMEYAYIHGFKWVVTLDQDSVLDKDYLAEINKRIPSVDDDIAIICPQIIDARRIYPANKIVELSNKDHFVSMCITSGSCTNVDAWVEVGKFDDKLFIDLVDNDFCKRLKINHWKILKMGNVTLNQEFGNIIPKNKAVVNFIKKICDIFPKSKTSVLISKLAYKKIVSPMRVYYTNRNIIYLNHKLKESGGIGYESYSCSSYIGFWLFFNLPSLIRGNNKKEILRSIFNGVKDGKKLIREGK